MRPDRAGVRPGCSPTSPTTSPIVRALGHETATIVGHDRGSPIATASALLRPDVFDAVGLLGVPSTPPGGPRPTEAFAQAGGDEEFSVSRAEPPPATSTATGRISRPGTASRCASAIFVAGHPVHQERPDGVDELLVAWPTAPDR
jgi:pimeloyl-ACP methyl ester carboxylesterase